MTGRRIKRDYAQLLRRIDRLKLKLTAALDADDADAVVATHTELEDTELALRLFPGRTRDA